MPKWLYFLYLELYALMAKKTKTENLLPTSFCTLVKYLCANLQEIFNCQTVKEEQGHFVQKRDKNAVFRP